MKNIIVDYQYYLRSNHAYLKQNKKMLQLNNEDQENSINSKKVLIIEDQEIAQKVHAFYLTPYKLELTFVSDGKSALKILKHTPSAFNLILLDIGLPDIDGLTLAKVLRKKKLKIPIVVISANTVHKREQRALSHHIQGFYVKPLTAMHYKQIIQKFFGTSI